MRKILSLRNYLRYGIPYLFPLLLLAGGFSYVIYIQDIQSFRAVMKNNEKQVLDFQETIIQEQLKTLSNDIQYLAGLQRTQNYVKSRFKPESDLAIIYRSFLKRKKIYSSIRIIDSGGFERFRMNYNHGNIIKVQTEDLQARRSSYYFNEIMNTDPEGIYFSRLDFNFENGVLQSPIDPTLRVARLFTDNKGTKTAFIILNYNGRKLFAMIDKNSEYSFGRIYIMNNSDLIADVDLSKTTDKKFIGNFLHTDRGKELLSLSEKQEWMEQGFLTYKKVKIADTLLNSDWILFSLVDNDTIRSQTYDKTRRSIYIFIVLGFLSLLLSFFIAKNKISRIETTKIIEERARIFDFNPAPVLKCSLKGETLSSNSAAKAILGLTGTPVPIHNLFDKLDKTDFNHIFSKRIYTFEYTVKDQTFHFTTLQDSPSSQIFFYGADITENSRIREELKKFQIAVKQSANVIVFTDLEGHILFTNDAFEKVTGYSSSEVMGERPSILKSGFHPDSYYKELWETITNGKVWVGEFYNKRKDGSFFWEKSTITPILNTDGKPGFYIAVKEDITERKRIQEELETQTRYAESARINAEEARAEAESANRHKSTFLANMSHEIRTPMNAILGFTRLLMEKDLDNEVREMIEIVLTSGENLLALINDILDFSKIEAGEIVISSFKINLSVFFKSIGDLFLIQTEKKNLDFRIELDKQIPEIVYGDENRIRQILINIIGNAIKFTDTGTVTVTVSWEKDTLKVRVSDTGIGIQDDKLGEIFSPFKQSDSSINRKYEGTGLGLAISRRLTELMEGSLKVESRLDKGSVFTLELPFEECRDSSQFHSKNFEERVNIVDSKTIVEGWLGKVRDDNILTAIVKDAIVSLPGQLKRLKTEIGSGNKGKLQALSHELMGSTGNLGMSEIYELLKELNIGIKNNTINNPKIRELYSQIEKIVDGIPDEYLIDQPSELLPIEGEMIDISILTADDSAVNRRLMKAMLSSIYLGTDFAEDGIEVLDKLGRKRYDILLLDIQMPRMDGLETIKHIRSNANYDELYVIAVTANAMRGDAQKYLDSGCNDYISKPIQKDILLKKIEYQIQKIGRSPQNNINLPDDAGFEEIIRLLENEIKVFNPARVKRIISRLEEYRSDKQIQTIITKLQKSADLFDSKSLINVVRKLKELKENAGNK